MRICAAWLLKHVPLRTIDLEEKAIGFYERAVQLDPNFALAWARLSRVDAPLLCHASTLLRRSGRRSKTCFGECAETGAELA